MGGKERGKAARRKGAVGECDAVGRRLLSRPEQCRAAQRMKLQRLPHNRYTRLQEQWVVVSALICVQLWLA